MLLAFSVSAAAPAKKQPVWQELTVEQQEVLAPLASGWNGFSSRRKKMWIDIATRYPGMAEEDQAKVQRRMQRWVKLSQEERTTVRENFKKLKQLPPEKKQSLPQEWDEYRKLPEEQRQKLGGGNKNSKDSAKGSSRRPGAPSNVPAPTAK
ncbi:MAG: hypothetical protein A3H35_09840 [Betaproteobacteria bacterium RIFCSPLOWO2_02_FULL_62_17]|nr:MAG: hypothetical protein A3H35_09840 [Betaproteobacteria bacterium RIFCSPLOWO2_02_FULL_62_17]